MTAQLLAAVHRHLPFDHWLVGFLELAFSKREELNFDFRAFGFLQLTIAVNVIFIGFFLYIIFFGINEMRVVYLLESH